MVANNYETNLLCQNRSHGLLHKPDGNTSLTNKSLTNSNCSIMLRLYLAKRISKKQQHKRFSKFINGSKKNLRLTYFRDNPDTKIKILFTNKYNYVAYSTSIDVEY